MFIKLFNLLLRINYFVYNKNKIYISKCRVVRLNVCMYVCLYVCMYVCILYISRILGGFPSDFLKIIVIFYEMVYKGTSVFLIAFKWYAQL